MERPARRGLAVTLGVAALVLIADQVTKAWAVNSLADGPVDVIPGVLRLTLTTNTGGAFSLFTDVPWFFAVASVVASAAIVIAARKPRPLWQAIALGAILGGALGNLADRVLRGPGLRGEVVDFIDMHVWPVFNLADSAIVLGAIGLAVGSVLADRAARSDA
jgi:signal peptidase II